MFASLGKFLRGLFCEDDAGTVPAPERVFGSGSLGVLWGGTGYHIIHTGTFAAPEMQAFGIATMTIIGAMGAVIAGKAMAGADTVKGAPPPPKSPPKEGGGGD